MFIGEMDYGDIPFSRGKGLSFVSELFIVELFIICFVIILMNLLNALAVSDIREIKKESELHSAYFYLQLVMFYSIKRPTTRIYLKMMKWCPLLEKWFRSEQLFEDLDEPILSSVDSEIEPAMTIWLRRNWMETKS